MRTKALLATTLFISAQFLYGIATSHAADLLWEVENPYRFFKRSASFEVQEKAFNAVRGAPGQPWLEPDISEHLRALAKDGVESVVVAPIVVRLAPLE